MDLLIVFTIYSIDRNSTMNKGGALGCMLMMEGGGTCTVRLNQIVTQLCSMLARIQWCDIE